MKEITSYNRAVQYLNKVFKLINAEFFNDALDMPTITVQSTAEAYGHITVSKVWTNELGLMSHELNVSADYLDRPMENVVATLIHEGCHLYAMANGIKDTSNRGIYHNRRFKELAEERGLKVRNMAGRLQSQQKELSNSVRNMDWEIFRLRGENNYPLSIQEIRKEKEQTVPSQLAKRKTAISVGAAPAAIQLSEALRR